MIVINQSVGGGQNTEKYIKNQRNLMGMIFLLLEKSMKVCWREWKVINLNFGS